MRSLRLAPLLVLALAASAGPVAAWPYIDVTASETLSTEPLRVRTTFEISFVGYDPLLDPWYFEVTPLDTATLHISACAGPPLWVCGPATNPVATGGVSFNAHSPGALSGPYGPFSIVTDRANPCVAIAFGGLPTMEGGYTIEACLLLDAPVPARPASWGALKATYR